jgi:hypothetical protein
MVWLFIVVWLPDPAPGRAWILAATSGGSAPMEVLELMLLEEAVVPGMLGASPGALELPIVRT